MVAINALNYDTDPENDLSVPLVCGNCVLEGFNNPVATDPNAALQAATRDPSDWMFRTVMGQAPDPTILLAALGGENQGDLNRDTFFRVTLYTFDRPSAELSQYDCVAQFPACPRVP